MEPQITDTPSLIKGTALFQFQKQKPESPELNRPVPKEIKRTEGEKTKHSSFFNRQNGATDYEYSLSHEESSCHL